MPQPLGEITGALEYWITRFLFVLDRSL